MIKKLRLLPLAIAILSVILGIRIVDFSFGVKNAFAQTGAPKQAAKLVKQQENKKVTKPDSARQLSSMPTREEIEYLEKLSQRRRELDRRARALNDREKLLKAVELRITERTNTLRKIEKTINNALKRHDVMKKAQLVSLVKIYSAMKPRDAAKIFNDLDDKVLLAIVENMQERKMGPIMAKMNLDKAKKLTVNLATRNKLPKIEG